MAELLAKARLFLDAVGAGRVDQLDALVAPDYQPRTPDLADVPSLAPGRDALRERLGTPIPHQIYRMVEDGDLVFAHARYGDVAGADIFRFDRDGRIAEHWNARQAILDDKARGVDRFAGGGDGEAAITVERRSEMKAVMTAILLDMWGKGDAALIPTFYDPAYIQHNPDMPGGYDRIREIVETNIRAYIDATGGPFPINIHRMGAGGDLIFVHYSIFMAGIGRKEGSRATDVDIFRIDAANRMIEHWDVLQIEGEPLPHPDTLY